IIIVGRWDVRVPHEIPMPKSDDDDRIDRMLQDGISKELSVTDSRRAFEDGIKRTLDALRGRRVYLLMQVPVLEKNKTGITRETYEVQQREVIRVLKARSHSLLHVIGPGKWFNGETSLVGDEGGSYYMDEDHLSSYGANKMISPLLEPVFKQISDR